MFARIHIEIVVLTLFAVAVGAMSVVQILSPSQPQSVTLFVDSRGNGQDYLAATAQKEFADSGLAISIVDCSQKARLKQLEGFLGRNTPLSTPVLFVAGSGGGRMYRDPLQITDVLQSTTSPLKGRRAALFFQGALLLAFLFAVINATSFSPIGAIFGFVGV